MAADFLVLGTPNYHGSYSGILKNALDHINMDYVKMKPVGLIGNSGGIVSSEPLSHLRVIVRSLLGILCTYTNCNTRFGLCKIRRWHTVFK